MTREDYPCRQGLDEYDTRRGVFDHAYCEWVYSMTHEDWQPTPGEFEAFVNFTANQLAVWNA